MADSERTPDVLEDFDEWAKVSVKLLKRTDEQAELIIEQLGLYQVWTDAKIKWSGIMARDAAAGKRDRFERFNALWLAEAKRREEQESPEDSADPTEDFRQRLQQCRPSGPSKPEVVPTAPSDPQVGFAERLAPPGHAPRPPAPGQSTTVQGTPSDTRNVIKTTREMLAWPVERYAELCVALEQYSGKTKLLCTNFGIESPMALDFVKSKWQERLDKEPALHKRWVKAVAALRKQG